MATLLARQLPRLEEATPQKKQDIRDRSDDAQEDQPTMLLNGLFLVRVFVKYFIDTLDDKGLAEQLKPGTMLNILRL